MPRVRRRAKHRWGGYSQWHTEELLSGCWFVRDLSFGGDRDAQRAAWEELRGELLPKWIAEHPGTRPFAWWAFDAPERRRALHGKQHPHDNPERWALVERDRREYPDAHENAFNLYFGLPALFIPAAGDNRQTKYESEPVYLVRLGLMTAEEREHPDVKAALAKGNNL